jgi:hypothetical protein
MTRLAESGKLDEAARDWMNEWANDKEMAVLEESGWLEASAEHVAVLLRLLEAEDAGDGYSPTAVGAGAGHGAGAGPAGIGRRGNMEVVPGVRAIRS